MDLDLNAEPVQGVLRHEYGPDKPFAGWVALIRALELALDDERRHNDQGTEEEGILS
ncbi:hypothetical protein OH768_35705 [Streptomyces sp. NBC_01622]|uniref:hypothetical protein n=1 Tax=Streptomyces sp. NBC_01622 TaxID=2975903 RepID=UPI003863DD62|nr:hypothetical protein OH768_35705 [Streptomyces sp. NBC_01622]